jgi:hypothetical protein
LPFRRPTGTSERRADGIPCRGCRGRGAGRAGRGDHRPPRAGA